MDECHLVVNDGCVPAIYRVKKKKISQLHMSIHKTLGFGVLLTLSNKDNQTIAL